VPEGLKLATVFLTRLPLRLDVAPSLTVAMPWFPVVGALLGLAAGLLFAGLTLAAMPSLPASLIVLAFLVVATGALHEDGLADCADALGPHERERRLEVMRDSRVGSFAVMALVLVTLARVAGLASLWAPGMQIATLVVVGAGSRAAMVAVMSALPAARRDGLAAGAGRPDARQLAGALVGPLLGMKSVTFGLGFGEQAVEERRLNTGSIALEIVAIAPTEPAPEAPLSTKRPTRPEPAGDDLEKLAEALESLRAVLASADLDPTTRREAERLLTLAARALAQGDGAAASAALEQIASLLQASRGGG